MLREGHVVVAVLVLLIAGACRGLAHGDGRGDEVQRDSAAVSDAHTARPADDHSAPTSGHRASPPAVAGGNIDLECDLEPDAPDYLEELAAALFGDSPVDPFAVCDMSVMASDPSWGIGFVRPPDEPDWRLDEGRNPTKRPWTLVLVQYEDARTSLRRKRDEKPVRREIEIDAASATVLEHAWLLVVRRARQPRPHLEVMKDGSIGEWHSMMADGEPFLFSSEGHRGETNVPKGGYADGISRLATGLRGVVLARPEDRDEDLKRWVELAQYMIDRIDAGPW